MTVLYNRSSEKSKRRALRKSMTEEEIILWSRLKGKSIAGSKFRRQYSIGPYIVDFYCSGKKLAIELDGGGHFTDEAAVKDKQRQAYIERFGIQFLRFTNLDIRKNLYGVLTVIDEKVKSIQ